MSKSIMDRLLEPLGKIGIDITNVKERAEAYAYQSAIQSIMDGLSNIKAAKEVSLGKLPLENADFKRSTYTVSGNLITFTKYREKSISKDINAIVPKFFNVSLGHEGWTWEEIEAKNKSFYDISTEGYRWDLIESR